MRYEKRLRSAVAGAFLCAATWLCAPSSASALPWIVLGDSIISNPTDGVPTDLPFMLLGQERGVEFRSLASPGAAMGLTTNLGFNGTWLTATLDRICGFYSYCDGVVIQAGVNDFNMNVPWADQQTSIRRVLDWAEARNKKVLMLDLIWMSAGELGEPNQAGLTFAQLRNARFLECYARRPRCVFALRPSAFNQQTPSYYYSAEVRTGMMTHLNPAGRRAYANWVAQAAAGAGLF